MNKISFLISGNLPILQRLKSKSTALYSVTEQLLLSAINLAISLAFVAFADKASFGLFAVMNSYLVLMLSIQTAVISTPLLVEFSSKSPAEVKSTLQSTNLLLLACACMVSFTSVLAEGVLSSWDNLALTLLFGAASFVGVLREYARTAYLMKGETKKSLHSSLIYGLVLVLSFFMWLVVLKNKLTAENVFGMLAFSGSIASIPFFINYKTRYSFKDARNIAIKLTPHIKWALPGVLVAWLQNSAYLTFVNYKFGASIAAELAAARLLIMPYMTMVAGYSRTLVAVATKRLENLSLKETLYSFKNNLKIQLLCGVILSALFIILDVLNQHYVFYEKYKNIFFIGGVWGVFAGLASVRGGLAIVIQSSKKFKELFLCSLFSLAVIVISFSVVYVCGFPVSVVISLCVAELALLWVLYKMCSRGINGK